MLVQKDEPGATQDHDAEIPRRSPGIVAPMSFAQELLWLLDRATPALTAYNVPRAIRIRGALDAEALRAAIDDVVARHEILRTTYAADERGAVQVVRPHEPIVLHHVDLSHVTDEEREAHVERVVLREAGVAFDIATDLLVRATLVRAAADDQTLILLSHHIASDGWSRGVLFRELSAAYAARVAGGAPTFAPLPIQYGDFAAWQREAMQGPALEEHLAFWRERLAPPLPVLDLPTDFPRPATQGFEGARRGIMLPAALVRRLRDLGMDHGATLYMVFLAAYQTVLHRYSGQEDILTGSPIAGRNHAATEGLIGYFANILAMRTNFAGDPTFADLLERIASNAMDAYEHDEVPFEKLVLDLRAEHETLGHAPLFRCVLTMEDTLPDLLRLGDAQVQPYSVDIGQAKFDLTLLVAEQPEGFRLGLWYRTDLFTGEYADRFLGHLRTVLEAVVMDPALRIGVLPMLTADERADLESWNATVVDEGVPATVVQLFEAQVARVPSRDAVVAGGSDGPSAVGRLSYAELNARSNQLAHHLVASGVQPGQPVGVLLDRSLDAIVGLLGVQKAGGAYMPLSADAPALRLATQLTESRAGIVIANAADLGRLPSGVVTIALDRDAAALAELSTVNLGIVTSPDSIAYLLHTSGSTGVPKGVAVTHANIVHYTRAVSRVLGDVPADRPGDGFAMLDGMHFGLVSTLAADLGNTSAYGALLAGGTLHVLNKEVTTEPARFAAYAKSHKLDLLKITPPHFVALTAGKRGADLAELLPSRWLVMGGDALSPAVARVVLETGACRVLNHYGPTEATVGVLTFEATIASLDAVRALGAQTVPLGRPLANTQILVLDAHDNEQPVGIPGELWVSGAGVTAGYLHRADLTADAFASFRGRTTYRSGDRVRRLANGTIEFLGRADHQVKVRGYRVELGEVEQALRSHAGVESVAAVLHSGEDAEPRLVAYVVPKNAGYAVSHNDRATPAKLREWAAARVPDYMVPGSILLLDAMPLTLNGKVDRAALPSPDVVADTVHVEPRTNTERQLVTIWSAVLKRDVVGVTDSFLDLGGHSLLAIRVLGRISKDFGVRLALRSLFETPTVRQIAVVIDAELAQRNAAAALSQALEAVESLSDAEVERLLAADDSPRDAR